MDLASTLGYFEREGVDVELVRVQQTPSAVAALQAGEGEMANVSVDAALQLVARDQMELKAVVSPNKSLPFLIAGKDEIAALADLAGRSFGVGRVGSLDHTLERRVLASRGRRPRRARLRRDRPAERARPGAGRRPDRRDDDVDRRLAGDAGEGRACTCSSTPTPTTRRRRC